jgi:hypothetical protein
MSRSKDFYLLLLAYAFVEIRYLAVEGDLQLAPRLADLFHHIPEALRLPWTEEREERVHAQMREKARLHGLGDLLDRWEQRALRRGAEEDKEQEAAGAPRP